MDILEGKTYPELLTLSRGKYRISLYLTSRGWSNASEGDCLGSSAPATNKAALLVARHLKAVNPIYVKLYDGSACLIADAFPPIQEQIEAGIKAKGTPNGSGIGYKFYSVSVKHPIFYGGRPLVMFENSGFDPRGTDNDWCHIEYVLS